MAQIEFACAPALAWTEYDGICLDLEQWEVLCADIQEQYEKSLKALYAFSGEPTFQLTLWGTQEAVDVNFDSNVYVLRLLRDNGIHVPNTSRYSLAPYHNHPLVKALTDYRRYSKLLSGFLHPLPAQIHPVTGRLHPKYGRSRIQRQNVLLGAEYPADSQGSPFPQLFYRPGGQKAGAGGLFPD